MIGAAATLILLSRDQELRRRLVNKTREIALRYSWEHKLDAMEVYYYGTLELWENQGALLLEQNEMGGSARSIHKPGNDRAFER